jgi:2-oxoisovalerate dehydrogenase E1 component alpha subunit
MEGREPVSSRDTSAPVAPALSATAEGELLQRIYRLALVTRAVDEHVWLLSRLGRASFVVSGRGHEVAQIGSALTVRRGHDNLWPYYRDMGVAIALGVSPFELFLGAMGRAGDPHTGGRQLIMHLSSPELRIGSVSSEIAAHIPHATGAAWAAMVRGEERVTYCWFGDGAASEGATHEAMNFASIHRMPVVFICENNGYAISVPLRLQMAVDHVADRASAYAMPGTTVDGTDALAVHAATTTAVDRARRGEGPSLVELVVPRMTPHTSQDDDTYRTADVLAGATAADPLPRLRAQLQERGLLDEEADARWREELEMRIRKDEDAAFAAPSPEPGRARRWLVAGEPRNSRVPEPADGVARSGLLDG